MRLSLGVFNTDQINRSGSFIPAAVLMQAEEQQQLDRIGTKLPPGLPVNMQHDMHRPVGWSQVLGHMIDGAMVRVVGVIYEAETDEEKSQLATLLTQFWKQHHEDGKDTFKEELAKRVEPAVLDTSSKFLQIESYVVSGKNLAAELYPELFAESSKFVDKDGLTDYRMLSKRMKQVQPGVFHDPERDILIFAHQFFRRSLSHRNKLNDYFLLSFNKMAAEHESVTPRLRLDPDLIGHPASIHNLVELEYWRGPRFNDDISSIPSGVSEHKASERTRYHEGVDRTQIWWKSPETRHEEGVLVKYRTFEVEELIDNPSGGLAEEGFGCRYAHAEFSEDVSAITHFDGAIRAYRPDAYFERIDTSINHAGKRSEYTKLFRFDGPLPIDCWKRLLSDYFRGNPLIPEYLSAPDNELGADMDAEDEGEVAADNGASRSVASAELCAFISIVPGSLKIEIDVELWAVSLPDGTITQTIETGCEAVDQFLRKKIDLSNITSLGLTDGTLNLSKLSFGRTGNFPASMYETVTELSKALRHDVERNDIHRVALALRWQQGELLTTLSFRGDAKLVVQAIDQLFSIVDPTKPASEWIEHLSDFIKNLAPLSAASQDLKGVLRGVLSIERTDEVELRMVLPDPLKQRLLAYEGQAE